MCHPDLIEGIRVRQIKTIAKINHRAQYGGTLDFAAATPAFRFRPT
jgi:hypothetical protein